MTIAWENLIFFLDNASSIEEQEGSMGTGPSPSDICESTKGIEVMGEGPQELKKDSQRVKLWTRSLQNIGQKEDNTSIKQGVLQ